MLAGLRPTLIAAAVMLVGAAGLATAQTTTPPPTTPPPSATPPAKSTTKTTPPSTKAATPAAKKAMPGAQDPKAVSKDALAKPMPGGGSAQKNGRVLSSNELNARPLDPIKQCYDAWDAGTHLSKERWRELCRVNLGERDKLGRR